MLLLLVRGLHSKQGRAEMLLGKRCAPAITPDRSTLKPEQGIDQAHGIQFAGE